MYLGEGRFYHERMGEFIKVAQDLQVKDLSNIVEMESGEEKIEETMKEETDNHEKETQPIPRQKRTEISKEKKSVQCPECGARFAFRHGMMSHYRSKHEGVKYPCNHCDYQATDRGNLQKHIRSLHEGIRYPCDECDYQASHQNSLQAHISAKHSDTILDCDSCDFQTKWRQQYYTHKKTHITQK